MRSGKFAVPVPIWQGALASNRPNLTLKTSVSIERRQANVGPVRRDWRSRLGYPYRVMSEISSAAQQLALAQSLSFEQALRTESGVDHTSELTSTEMSIEANAAGGCLGSGLLTTRLLATRLLGWRRAQQTRR